MIASPPKSSSDFQTANSSTATFVMQALKTLLRTSLMVF